MDEPRWARDDGRVNIGWSRLASGEPRWADQERTDESPSLREVIFCIECGALLSLSNFRATVLLVDRQSEGRTGDGTRVGGG